MAEGSIIKPSHIPNASPEQLAPVLLRLLECPTQLLPTLSQQCHLAIAELPLEDRPTSYEGLIDVARFCVDDEPGWEVDQKAMFVGGHPRIGAPLVANAQLSEESRKEQLKGGQADPETLERLARLNSIYEARFPGLRFVTYVAGRSRALVADEMEQILGPEISKLADTSQLAPDFVRPQGSVEWDAELERGSDALWEIAVDRAGKLSIEVDSASKDSKEKEEEDVPPPMLPDSSPGADAHEKALNQDREGNDSKQPVGQDVPFLSLATFRMLALSSPVLESFFEKDLSASFYLDPAEKSQSGGAYAWHTAPNLPGAPRAVPGASTKDGTSGTATEASYSKDVTTGARGKVVGFLGGLLGEEGKAKMNQLADQVGQRLQTHTVTGPKPSFGRKETLDGGKMDTQELRDKEAEERRKANEERKFSLGSRLAGALRSQPRAELDGRSPSNPEKDSASNAGASADEKARKRQSLRGTDISITGPMGAAETLRAAQESLVQERPAFVIDEVGEPGDEDGDAEADGEVVDDEIGMEDVHAAEDEERAGLLKGKEAQMAKDLRSAPPQ
ncbi:hypothetical protein IE53DRAFT_384779 [Violaceomyces palustris]|uniref:Uncharacterized protein n=1 Tax=Violaceomyces palustris TaxID=1673888 RepID=A0ACD0P3X5_9BASI|nr:hypothetical protein IE53DRAFT_384779 [Violaceomyces palustris]